MRKLLLIASLLVILSGCTPAPNVQLNQSFWQHKEHVKVANDQANRKDHAHLYKLGAQGLLDLAVNDVVTNKFEQYLEANKLTALKTIQADFIKQLRQHHMDASAYPVIDVDHLAKSDKDKATYAVRDYHNFATKLGKNKLLIISAKEVGAERHYYGMIPLGSPKAVCAITGQLIDTKTNKILWRYASFVKVPVDGNWDQPPKYPNFTRALNQAITVAKAELLDNFFSGAGVHS